MGTACLPRFARLEWVTPLEGARLRALDAGVGLSAQLSAASGRVPLYPASLNVVVQAPDGGLSSAQVQHAAGGLYLGAMGAPFGAPEGRYALRLEVYGGLDAGARTVVLDRMPPAIIAALEQVPQRGDDAGLTVVDPALPAGAFRRDETVDVTVTSLDEDFPDAGVVVTVLGLSTDGGAPPTPASAVAPVSAGCRAACGTGACRCFRVDLSAPVLDAFRGALQVEVSATDGAGNVFGPALAGTVPVTRWKWRLATGYSNARAAPGVGLEGRLFLAAGSALSSVGADGLRHWSRGSTAVSGSAVAVGLADGGWDLVAAVMGDDPGFVWGIDGGVQSACLGISDSLQMSPALLHTTVAGVPALTAVYLDTSSSNPVLFWPRATGGTFQVCAAVAASGWSSGPSNATVSGLDVLANGDSTLHGFAFDGTSWQSQGGGGGVSPPYRGVALDLPSGAALVNGAGVMRSTAPVPGTPTQVQAGANFGPVAVSAPGVWWAGSDLNGGMLHRFGPTAADGGAQLPAALATAPVIGASGLVYLAAANGEVQARSVGDLALRWRLPLGEGVTASPNLDVSRDGAGAKLCSKPGVLYVLSTAGNLYALLVDSPGLERTAPWPRYQHDPRNSGNADWSLAEFTCP